MDGPVSVIGGGRGSGEGMHMKLSHSLSSRMISNIYKLGPQVTNVRWQSEHS